jgi:putative oxidoreductase
MSIALLIVRVIMGLGLAAHGSQKLFGWFGGYGLSGTGGFFDKIGFRPGRLFAFAAGLGEFAGGLLTAFGLGGALGPVMIVCVMLVVIGAVHLTKGFFSDKGGWELPAMYACVALAIAFAGNGRFSIDAALGLTFLTDPLQTWIALGAALVISVLNIAAKRPSAG